MQTAMEIEYGNKKIRLYSSPTYEEWFDNHNYDWRYRRRSFRDHPNSKHKEMYQKATTRFLQWQGKIVKTFMQNSDGEKRCKQQMRYSQH